MTTPTERALAATSKVLRAAIAELRQLAVTSSESSTRVMATREADLLAQRLIDMVS